ncbi:glutathione peroxidase [Pectinatus frisingensis]|jgi:glutathione peroxidase|uniref:glutathione peroxidase n=1 Tax=Pectinatus frisingensis TaxID=865 RepID=UPI0015F36537|nr:glutathione peroxidase [Pectinatus frisingensis]
MSIYDFTVKTNHGEEKSLADYKGKVLIIVNTASKCGFTPQYEELEKVYLKYKDKGFEILAFPSNQFAQQEPGSAKEIEQFCKLNYGVTFPIFEKNDVRGETAQPLFKYLISQQAFKGFDQNHPNAKGLQNAINTKFPSFMEGDSIKWNFTKFLVDKQGNVVGRYEPTTTPLQMTTAIEKLID